MDKTNTTSRSERRDAAENRQRILDVASTLFELHGVERVSMNQIASEAQIGAGTLYRRYRNKSELCMDLIKDNAALFFDDVEIYLQENAQYPPTERLRGLLTLFIQFREKNAELLSGIENAVYQGSESRTSSPLYDQLHQQLFGLFEEMATESDESQAISLFKTDMLLTAMSNDSYLFQKNVRGNSPDRIVEQLCLTFL
ncbi:TetR/AcrR family transcriptional regulator [Paenibacillus marchantiae]|uniref:TetR/AcrR family transcriptional regulator n=1 Tax=Paenibacillus TaxID=44249 RepID=UPI0007E3615C|nr:MULTISPECIES: TetR/AcrR family transcriptional regulator [Paenibacillus]OAX48910.1 HTH-type transcriptional regulator AcrR [Paenibacillus sp. AD87]WDQ30700.1 TetR/AcrR family transcriptional regulator [Paenibacillus marchantiae]SDK15527.1 transcriptional regulator, TetR family [Paenibacillus sp. OK060]SEA49222.1 transcriptional regulator, TetR family [Paenibacillus sp. 276b]